MSNLSVRLCSPSSTKEACRRVSSLHAASASAAAVVAALLLLDAALLITSLIAIDQA